MTFVRPLCFALPILVLSLSAATPEEQSVLAPIQAMFKGMANRDATAIKEPLLPGA